MAHRLSAGLAALVMLLATTQFATAELALKRVALSTGGVGYFEYEAQVDGDAALSFEVPLDQVDDVLKSLVIYDSGGTAGEVTLPGREPLTQGFVDLPFDRAALNSAIDLLNALQGADIRIGAPKAISGRLVHVDSETIPGPADAPETRTRVSVLTDAGLQQVALQDVDAIAFADPKLQAQVATALQRIATYRDSSRRQLTVQLHGKAARTVRLGYVVAMPLWKASYRLSLPSDPGAPNARLQGWAVLENFSGRAWDNVELTLLSGNPVTFRQALYESYYVERPEVPVESGSHVLPPPDTGTAGPVAAKAQSLERQNFGALRAMPGGMARDMATDAAPPPPMAAPVPAPAPARLESAGASDEPTQIVFTAADKVSVAAGQSLVLPLLDRDLPARRVDLYQPFVNAQHPLAAIELTNNAGTGLPPGVLTLYQQNDKDGAVYFGDARLAALPAGDKRLLSFAVDGKVTVVATSHNERRPVVKATAAQGVVKIDRKVQWSTGYQVKSAATAPLKLLIDWSRRAGATLTAPDPHTVELTPAGYRIPLALPPNQETSVTITEEQPIEETIRLLDVDDNRLGALASSTELDPKVRQVFADIAGRRAAIAKQQAELAQAKEHRAQLAEDEKRLRDNLAVLGSDPTLRKRMLDQFGATETAIETLASTIDTQAAALARSEQDLRQYVSNLSF